MRKRVRLGKRTLKTGLAVFLCLLIFHVLHRGNPVIAALSASFSLRQDFKTSISFGKSRLVGNTIGGVLALFFILINNQFHQHFLVELFVLPLMIVVAISFSNLIKNNDGIIGAISTILLISLSVPKNETILFATDRVLDTFIGTLVAISLNIFVHPKASEEVLEIEEDIALLKRKELELEALKLKIENKRKTEKGEKNDGYGID